MAPSRNRPGGESQNSVPGKRLPYWLRESDHHPMVESRPGEIAEGTIRIANALRQIRSPSPERRGFSRFSSRAATPNPAVHRDTPSQYPVYSFPPPPPPQSPPPVRRLPPLVHRPPLPARRSPPPVQLFPLSIRRSPPPFHRLLSPLRRSPPPLRPPPALPQVSERANRTSLDNSSPRASGSGSRDQRDPLTVSIAFPVESNAINAPATIRVCVRDTRKSFAEFWGEMCKNMQLDQTVAALGYKFTGDRVKDPPRALSTAEDYRIAMEEIQRRVRTARTKEHKLVLHNLSPKPSTAAPKRKSGDVVDLPDAGLSSSFFKQLRHKCYCKSHRRLCFVRQNGSVVEHEEVDEVALSFWAQMIVERQATLDIPPNTMLYDCRQRKRRKATQSNPAFPSIHIHNHLPGSSARIDTNHDTPVTPPPMPPTPPPVMKRSMSTQQAIPFIIDLTNSDDNDSGDDDLDGIRYPGIPAMLAELDREYPNLRLTRYEEVLVGNGFAYVSQLAEEGVRRQLEDLGIRVGVINVLLSRVKRVMRRTQKLKQED